MANLILTNEAFLPYNVIKQSCNSDDYVGRTYSSRSYAQINAMLLEQAFLLIVRIPTLSQVRLLPILLWPHLSSPCKALRELLCTIWQVRL